MWVGLATFSGDSWSANRFIVGIFAGGAVCASFILPFKQSSWHVSCIYVPLVAILALNEIGSESPRIGLVAVWALCLFSSLLATWSLFERHRQEVGARKQGPEQNAPPLASPVSPRVD